jgi:hypothetical protein
MVCREDFVFEALLKWDQIPERRRERHHFSFLVRVLVLLNVSDYFLALLVRLSV